MKINKWTTANGASVELHTKHLTTESYTTDWGQEKEKAIDHISIKQVIVNGKSYAGMIGRKTLRDTRVLDLGRNIINGKKTHLYVPIPAEIEQDVWGAYDARQKAKFDKDMALIKSDAEDIKHKVARGYCTKCESYCYGDCQS